ncbi:MAG TPA: HD domain-containing phosphohydrolase [Thermoleophilaceae bacterium]|nr:HD domain-containing phosphohydrolase [Thermoleophilaceae bacterium]
MSRTGWVLWALVASGMVLYAAHTAFGFGSGWVWEGLLYTALIGCAAVACFARAIVVRRERLAWAVMGVGLAGWMGGELYWTLVLNHHDVVPVPSPADGLYYIFYAASYVTLVLLLRGRMKAFQSSLWLDGAIAGTAVAACVGAVAFQPIVDATVGEPVAIAVNLGYPLGDLLLLSLVVASFALSGWRPDRRWILIGLGLGLMAVADGVYLLQSANGTYVEGTVLDALWPASALLVGAAAWQPVTTTAVPRIDGWRVVAIPALCAVVAVGLLTYDHFERVHNAALVLASATALLVTVRMALMFRENQGMLEQSRTEALTDALTGLQNRRSLMIDLEAELALATEHEPRALVLLDLDGFKQYNDDFGHLAGDGLLARLGGRLQDMTVGHGCAYRLGGDEFCALLKPGEAGLEPLVTACSAALSDRGEGFEIGASHGAVLMPMDASTPTEVLQIADRRMYAAKGGRRASAGRQSRDVLLRTLSERYPDLHEHLHDVAQLATGVGRELSMNSEDLDVVARAAELHDVGKVAIPDAILNKPGPLDEKEWSFMRRHTVIGERILLAAPALRPVARLVRLSHECWDGSGYPDGLAGEAIPLGARIVGVCDAFDAMTTDRPYRSRMSDDAALAELRARAGTQFDANVVEAFARALASLAPESTPAESPAGLSKLSS